MIETDTFEMRVQCPPSLTRRYIVALAYEKMQREIEAKGWHPEPRSFQVIWLDARYGVAMCRAVRETPLTPVQGEKDPPKT